ncbi:hypothetical protein AE618_12025 [Bosea vaviloviae]|uniref:Uncharacterized protein n=2 Tax=Bosea vaviloviae TaxID=1526658 RepID=A0A0N0MB62_9HYPH|nr:hypothetical protein AE618_12025 [Bosea vaviloviae]
MRAGETAKAWSSDPYGRKLDFHGPIGEKPGYVLMTFKMPSKGGGVTDVRVELSGDAIEQLAEMMIRADRENAIKAFGRALQLPPEPPETWE